MSITIRFGFAKMLSLMVLSAVSLQSSLHARAQEFVHLSTHANTSHNVSYLPADPNTNHFYLLTLNGTPHGLPGLATPSPISVGFSRTRLTWAIINQNGAAMPVGAGFNLFRALPGTNNFVHRATASTITTFSTYLNHPALNNNPRALIQITPCWNPGGTPGGIYNPHYTGVFYDTYLRRWAIYNEDHSPMPLNASFNVVVWPQPDAQNSVQRVLNGNGDTRLYLTLPRQTPHGCVYITHNYNPGGTSTHDNNNPVAVAYDTRLGRWYIYNQNGVLLPPNAAFNVFFAN